MKAFILKMASVLVVLFPTMAYAAQQQAGSAQSSTIQILLEKDSEGNPKSAIIDAKGVKTDLTLGSLLSATAESWLNGPIPASTIDPNTIAIIRIYKEGDKLNPYLEDDKGRHELLNLGNLIAGSAEVYPGCTNEQIKGQTVDVKLVFDIDSAGHVETLYTGLKGKESFNLGVLVRDVTIALNQCKK